MAQNKISLLSSYLSQKLKKTFCRGVCLSSSLKSILLYSYQHTVYQHESCETCVYFERRTLGARTSSVQISNTIQSSTNALDRGVAWIHWPLGRQVRWGRARLPVCRRNWTSRDKRIPRLTRTLPLNVYIYRY